MVYLTNESRIKKVGALLAELQIGNREIKDDFSFDLNKQKNEIDYDKVYKVIDEKRKISREYLVRAIKKMGC